MPFQRPPKPPLDLRVRLYCPADEAFVTDSWARSFLHSPAVRNVDSELYKVEHRARIKRLLGSSITLILCSADKEDHVIGFTIFERPKASPALAILHYLLIHASLQGNGFGSLLLKFVRQTSHDAEDPIWTTHWTIPMKNLMGRWNLIYNPYLLEVPK